MSSVRQHGQPSEQNAPTYWREGIVDGTVGRIIDVMYRSHRRWADEGTDEHYRRNYPSNFDESLWVQETMLLILYLDRVKLTKTRDATDSRDSICSPWENF